MIALIDKREYAIRLCEDEDDRQNVFIDEGYPNWKGTASFFSDIGKNVFLSGKEAEGWLDANNIFYIHIEEKPFETFAMFAVRLSKETDAHRKEIERSTTQETMVYGVSKNDFHEYASFATDNVFAIIRDNETGEYHTRLNLGEYKTAEGKAKALRKALEKAEKEIGGFSYGAEDDDFYEDVNLSSGKSLLENLGKLRIRLAILEGSL